MNRIPTHCVVSALISCIAAIACSNAAPSEPEAIRLENSEGKSDQAGVITRLTDESPATKLFVECDSFTGCAGTVSATLESPDVCSLFPDEPLCGIGGHQTLELDLASLVARNFDGPTDTQTLTALAFDSGFLFAFTVADFAMQDHIDRVDIVVAKQASAPNLTVRLSASWKANPEPTLDAGVPDAEPGSCEGQCGGFVGNCWCDSICEDQGDCCPDRDDFCPAS